MKRLTVQNLSKTISQKRNCEICGKEIVRRVTKEGKVLDVDAQKISVLTDLGSIIKAATLHGLTCQGKLVEWLEGTNCWSAELDNDRHVIVIHNELGWEFRLMNRYHEQMIYGKEGYATSQNAKRAFERYWAKHSTQEENEQNQPD